MIICHRNFGIDYAHYYGIVQYYRVVQCYGIVQYCKNELCSTSKLCRTVELCSTKVVTLNGDENYRIENFISLFKAKVIICHRVLVLAM